MSPCPWASSWQGFIILATFTSAAKYEALNRPSHESAASAVSLPSLAATVEKKDAQPQIGKFPWEPRKEETKRKLMNAIHRFRAEICYRMKKEAGMDFGTYEKCEEFMREACIPGRDEIMDGDHQERSSGEGYCTEYFHEAEEKARKELEEEERRTNSEEHVESEKEAATSSEEELEAASTAPSPDAPSGVATGGAPSPAVAESPAGAPKATPVKKFTPGISDGKPEGELGDAESWYYKQDGKHPDRLHMSESRKLPTQGYWGKLVAHEDMETVTSDWQQEHDPKDHERVLKKTQQFCRDYPDSKWCGRHDHHNGFFSKLKSSAYSTSATVPLVLAVIMSVANLRTS